MNQKIQPVDRSTASRLSQFINDCRIIHDPAYAHVKTDWFTDQAEHINIVSNRFRRSVYVLKTDAGVFFLKSSPVRRKKDRLRFLMLPWRIKTEWRNLKRLEKKSVPVPRRVLFGYKGLFPNHGFFLVTESVPGSEIDCRHPEQMLNLAGYLARLHDRGIYHRDLHPENILLNRDSQPVLLDVQEAYCLPWLPHRLRISNLAQFWWHLQSRPGCPVTLEAFLQAYNSGRKKPVPAGKVAEAAERRRRRYYRSRSARCLKNSTEFHIIKNGSGVRGFKRRDFEWRKKELQIALARGHSIKDDKLLAYENVCIKIHKKRLFHKDRSLASWKMARALAVRGIKVPEALAYFNTAGATYFLSAFYAESLPLNDYFSSGMSQKDKTAAIKRLARWLRACHDMNIWQRDFKSTNILVQADEFMMVDLEGVRIRRSLPWRKRLINLAQLNASVSNHLTLKDRLLFFHYYCRGDMLPRAIRRQAYEKIWAVTLKKNTLPFGLDPERLMHPLIKSLK